MAELPLDQLIAEAEAGRQLQICNACRYCEGFCAVFPAMARRLEFPTADIHYLANLCHNCGACLYACQYAPPHEFAVNVPRALAQVRGRTYRHYAWPAACGRLYERNGLTVALALAAGLALFLALALQINGTLWATAAGGNFYAVLPHRLMAAVFSAVSACACVALGIGVLRFWRDVSPGAASAVAVQEATRNVLQLTYLDGGHGQGCNDNSDAWTRARRRWHHVTFYGFVLCAAATAVASLYHYGLDWPAPYGWTTLPKLLGTAGGVGLLVGPLGLAWLHRRRNPQQGDPAQAPMDLGFMALLFAISLSGFALVLGRAGAAMPLLLCIHLGAVMALFATMPYGKFAHGIYRSAALLQWAIERRLPTRLGLKSD